MNCPNCDCYTPDDSPVCVHCGEQLPAVEAVPRKRQSAASFPSRSVHSGRNSGILSNRSVLVVGIIALVGVLLFFLFRSSSPHAYVTDFPDGPINLTSMIESGKTNIVDLYSEYCPPCHAIAPYLEKLAKARPDIHVIRIDINRKDHKGIDWGSPIARQFNLRSIPHFLIIGGEGKVLKEGKSAYKKVVDMIKETVNQ
ncbi:MAG: thioredoxin family protein [Acidobacteria bacterium]|nr:thioredoxin family protein [Acidobacteriota bacterium]